MLYKPKEENLAKLTPEQRKIYDGWVAEQETFKKLWDQSLAAMAQGDVDTIKKCFAEMDKVVPSVCEHGRSIWKECADCDEIEKIVYPEAYDEHGHLKEEDPFRSIVLESPITKLNKKLLN